MQSTKDSFFVALRDRLAALAPERTVFLNGVVRPAVIVAENEPVTSAAPLAAAFYLEWGPPRVTEGSDNTPRPLLALDCAITYRTSGNDATGSVDRGRVLAALDQELFQICFPPDAPKQDHTQASAVDLGPRIFWTRPQLEPAEAVGSELRRTARLSVLFFPEVEL
jgi:hypothetical protein